ncbi:hypothetical protein QTG54_002773 [Skeletonema marinoi]|uniref:Uncharacterized protein n=1 Tax=Skeletonema marinoi TaxID=267567 RepID=A0AAD8YGM9_9STRA|nr:hypothetical protein QTG54_002773 [Skeletonema marinoi]
MVDEVEMKDSMKRLNGGATTLSEALDNSGVDTDKRSLLFGFNEEGSVKKWTSRIPAILAGLCIVPVVFMAIYVKMFNWTTEGLLEQLLFMQVSAINFYYSIIDCVKKVNNGTGYGWAFTVLYGIFMLGTPMLRATLLLVITVIPMSPLWHLRIAKMSNHVGSFIGWEPFFICVIIMAFELPT